MALCESGEIKLSDYKKNSLQGDSCLVKIYESLGVSSKFNDGSLILSKNKKVTSNKINLNLIWFKRH